MDTGAAIDGNNNVIFFAVVADVDANATDNTDTPSSPSSSFDRGRKLFEKILCWDLNVVLGETEKSTVFDNPFVDTKGGQNCIWGHPSERLWIQGNFKI